MQGALDMAIFTIKKLVGHPFEIDACMRTTIPKGTHRTALVNNKNPGFLIIYIDTETATARIRNLLQPAQKTTHLPSIAFLRSLVTGFLPSQILFSARLKSAPLTTPFEVPLITTSVPLPGM